MKKKLIGIVLAFVICATAIFASSALLKPVSASTGFKKTVTTVTTVGSSKTIAELTSNDAYKVRDSFYDLADTSVNRMASEHFQIIWGNSDTTNTVNTEFVKGNLINLENMRTFYINELGMKDITTSTTNAISGKYKVNVYISATGLTKFEDDWAYMSADYEGFSYLFLAPGAMRVDEPSWVLPHELAHAFTYHQGGEVPGTWYESMANWFRDQYLGSSYYAYGDNVYGPTSDFFTPYLTSADCYVPHMLNWYDTWPIFLYISENPDNIDGLGMELMHKILEQGNSSTSMYETIEQFSGVSIKTILAGMSKRMATMDFERQEAYLKHLNEEALTVSGNYEKIYTTLENADSKGYQSVPQSKAPMQTGFNIIPLKDADLTKGSINIDFVNTSTASEADFRVTLVTSTANNTTRYSKTISDGETSIKLNGDETSAYLVVCATPDKIEDFTVNENSQATDASTRYTYKVKITYSDKVTEKETESETEKVTEKETESEAEKVTEEATQETSAPVSKTGVSYYIGTSATKGTYNVTENGTYGNLYFNFRKIGKNYGTLRPDYSSQITFTLDKKTDITLTVSGKDAVIMGGAENITFQKGTTTKTLEAGSYYIVGTDADKDTKITKIVLGNTSEKETEKVTEKVTEKETQKVTEAETENITSSNGNGINIVDDTINVKAGETVSFDTIASGTYYFEISNASWWFEPANGFVDVWNSKYNHIMLTDKTNTFSINRWCGLSDGYSFTLTAYGEDGSSDTVTVIVNK